MPIPLTELQLFTNNAVSLLASPISASDTTLLLMSGFGPLFPSPGPNEFFLVTLEDQAASVREIIKVTGRTGDVLTGLVRAQEGTAARSWSASLGNDTLVDHRVTAETMNRMQQLPIAGSGGATNLNALTDVDLTVPPVNGQVLKYNGSQWVAAADTTFVPGSIDVFTDVNTSSTPPAVGQVLKWNGTNWVPANDTVGVIGSIDQHTDVDTSTVPPVVGQTLKWNGTNWVPGADNDTIFNPAVVSINAFADVDTGTVAPTVGQVLQWNGTNWVPYTFTGGTAWINGANTLGTNIDPAWQLPISTTAYADNNRTFKYLVTILHTASKVTRAFEIFLTISGNLGTNAEVVHATQYATVGPAVLGDLHATLNTSLKTVSLEWENLEAVAVLVNVTRIQHQPV